MSEFTFRHVSGCLFFLGVSLLILVVNLMPLRVDAGIYVAPDVWLAFAFALVVRTPRYAPVLLVGAVALLFDLILHRPPGLWAALVLLGGEMLHSRAKSLRAAGLLIQCLFYAIVTAGMAVIYKIALVVFLLEGPRLADHMVQIILSWPCFALFSGAIGLYLSRSASRARLKAEKARNTI